MAKDFNKVFLKRLEGCGVTEISDLTRNLGGIKDYDKLVNTNKDLFFISFIPNEKRKEEYKNTGKLPRTKNEYVKAISYARADFDIRCNIYERENRIISEGELLMYKDRIVKGLLEDERLSSLNAVIHSGNGIHIYWIGKEIEIDAKKYSEAMEGIYKYIKYVIFPNEPHLWPDFACSNIGRLLRLPGSWNHKSKYGLAPHEVEILYYGEDISPVMEQIDKYEWADYCGDIKCKEIKSQIDALKDLKNSARRLGLVKNGGELYDKINKEIKITDLVCEYTGWKLAEDGSNFISNRDGCYTGAFVIPEENIVIHMGTPHILDYYKAYSPFAFIMVHYANGDAKKTFEIAQEKFPWLKEKKGKFLFKKLLVKNAKQNK